MTYPSQPQQQPGALAQPNALQIRDAYAQLPAPSPSSCSSADMAASLPTQFGKPKPTKLKKHARSSGAQPKRYITGSNHLPLAKRDRWMHLGGYKNEVGAEPPVEGRGDAPNRRVAGELKDMLKEEKEVMFFEVSRVQQEAVLTDRQCVRLLLELPQDHRRRAPSQTSPIKAPGRTRPSPRIPDKTLFTRAPNHPSPPRGEISLRKEQGKILATISRSREEN
jgi:hypothetical protein